MYKFNQWLKLREAEADEFGQFWSNNPEDYQALPGDWQDDYVDPEDEPAQQQKQSSPQQQPAPQQNPQQGQQQPAQRQPFSFSKALGIRPDQAEMKDFPNQKKVGLFNKVKGSPGFGRWFYIQMGLSDAEKAKIVNSWKPEFATGTAQNNAPQNQGTNPQSGSQQFTQKQLDARSLRNALTDLDRLAKTTGDMGAASMLDKVRATVMDGQGRLDPNVQKAIIDAYKNDNLSIFKNAYEASRRIR